MADTKMMWVEDDIQKIQVKTNLYLKSYGPDGAFHLAKEVIQNSIDELADPESCGSRIVITCDRMEDSLTVEDDGRGIPEVDFPLDICCTKLQSGSKFMRDAGSNSAGELSPILAPTLGNKMFSSTLIAGKRYVYAA